LCTMFTHLHVNIGSYLVSYLVLPKIGRAQKMVFCRAKKCLLEIFEKTCHRRSMSGRPRSGTLKIVTFIINAKFLSKIPVFKVSINLKNLLHIKFLN